MVINTEECCNQYEAIYGGGNFTGKKPPLAIADGKATMENMVVNIEQPQGDTQPSLPDAFAQAIKLLDKLNKEVGLKFETNRVNKPQDVIYNNGRKGFLREAQKIERDNIQEISSMLSGGKNIIYSHKQIFYSLESMIEGQQEFRKQAEKRFKEMIEIAKNIDRTNFLFEEESKRAAQESAKARQLEQEKAQESERANAESAKARQLEQELKELKEKSAFKKACKNMLEIIDEQLKTCSNHSIKYKMLSKFKEMVEKRRANPQNISDASKQIKAYGELISRLDKAVQQSPQAGQQLKPLSEVKKDIISRLEKQQDYVAICKDIRKECGEVEIIALISQLFVHELMKYYQACYDQLIDQKASHVQIMQQLKSIGLFGEFLDKHIKASNNDNYCGEDISIEQPLSELVENLMHTSCELLEAVASDDRINIDTIAQIIRHSHLADFVAMNYQGEIAVAAQANANANGSFASKFKPRAQAVAGVGTSNNNNVQLG